MNTSTPKISIGNRLVPILDLIFLLLIFFIILPHGIRSKELLQIENLREEVERGKMEARENGRDIRRKLEYYRWQYGAVESEAQSRRIMVVTLSDNLLYPGLDSNKTSAIPKEEWQQYLRNNVKLKNYDSVLIQIRDSSGEPTELGTLMDLQSELRKMELHNQYTITPLTGE